MKRICSLVAAAVLVLTAGPLAVPATAQDTQDGLRPMKITTEGQTLAPQDQPVLVESRELLPDRRSEIVLPSFELRVWSDGTRSLVGTVEVAFDELPLAIDYVADLEAGTYRATRSTPTEESRQPNPGSVTRLSERFQSQPSPGLAGSGSELQGLPSAATVGYSASGSVRTEDPAFLDLTKTTSVLDWTVTNGVTFNWTRAVDRCWAANPSALGTHWFIDWCTGDGGYFKGGDAPVCNRAEGKYHNDDFLDNTKRTHVQQWVETCGGNGFARFTWSHSDWGEAAGLLTGKFSSP